MKLWRGALVLALVLTAAGAEGSIPGSRCDGQGEAIYALGVRTQSYVTYRLFVPALYRQCKRERGFMTIAGATDSEVVDAALTRNGMLWGLDRPLTTDEKAIIESDAHVPFLFRVSPIHQIPVYAEGVAVGTNVGCTREALKIRSNTLSLIYMGLITRWDDPVLVADNPSLLDCKLSIRVAVRADADRRTDTFRDYLMKRNRQWAPFASSRTALGWPPSLQIGCRGQGDAGMATCIAGYPGGIGYVTMAEAKRRGLRTAAIENSAGTFVAPTPDGCTTAADAATTVYPASTLNDWSVATITDQPLGYPICTLNFSLAFQWATVAYGSRVAISQLRTMVDYLNTQIGTFAQDRLERLSLAKLPPRLKAVAQAGIDQIAFSFNP